jgi:hypothetical protein
MKEVHVVLLDSTVIGEIPASDERVANTNVPFPFSSTGQYPCLAKGGYLLSEIEEHRAYGLCRVLAGVRDVDGNLHTLRICLAPMSRE